MKTLFLKPGEIKIDRELLLHYGTDGRRVQRLVQSPEALQFCSIVVIHYQGRYSVLDEEEPLLALKEINSEKPIPCVVYECETKREIADVMHQRYLEREERDKENSRKMTNFMRRVLRRAKKEGISLADAVVRIHCDSSCRAAFSQ